MGVGLLVTLPSGPLPCAPSLAPNALHGSAQDVTGGARVGDKRKRGLEAVPGEHVGEVKVPDEVFGPLAKKREME